MTEQKVKEGKREIGQGEESVHTGVGATGGISGTVTQVVVLIVTVVI